ncbi:MAG: aldo/keto reductase, partial [Chloroflexi bacterium]|nr:aldo/keto reductase [Chloroflexota bacterium]
MSIQLRELGKSGLNVSPIGLGVMQFAGGKGIFRAMFPAMPGAIRIEIIKTALQGGINWFDTAEMYGAGQSEKYLSGALKEIGAKEGDLLIATKWSPFFRFAGNISKTIQIRLNNLSPYP